ncbi:uncharacterized protein LOC108607849 [Drosophila busckii]|uniref:uncharacterized protein LOC108607849 n=1 Tax=Drosophila busckii TaxID=30019 RepID=UPI001433399E|nr:uncharacterized protein LOC108607849 [Drosophila busckii]
MNRCKQAAEPKKRGRPRKNPLSESSSTRQTDNVNINEFISKHLDRVAKNGLPLATANNGFERGLKPDSVLAAFDDEGQRYFAVKFKNRKSLEIIENAEMKRHARALLIEYYFSNVKVENDTTFFDLYF